MAQKTANTTYWLLTLLVLLSVLLILKGCRRDQYPDSPAEPAGGRCPDIRLKLAAGQHSTQAKAMGVLITTEVVDDSGTPTGEFLTPVQLPDPVLPLDISLILYTPPCQYRITVTVSLSRDAPRHDQFLLDACQQTEVELFLDTFEEMLFPVGLDPIHAPASALAGETIPVRCGPVAISAPDSDEWPLTAMLREQEGTSASGPIDVTTPVSGSFPDPYALTSPKAYRRFICTITDGRSPEQTFEKVVSRILPTPTPTSTPTPTPTPTPTSTPTPTPTATPTPTPTPTPDPCQVTNQNDSGAGSLRQVLAGAGVNGCTTITFAPGISTITLGSQLTISSGTLTINGGSGVTVSGGNTTRVFWVDSGADVTFQNMTITDGRVTGSNDGGGIYNNGGTVTIASGCTVSSNTASTTSGGSGGIANVLGGTVIVNGTISGNTARYGGGISNEGTLTVNGTISGNTATWNGGGIRNLSGGTVTFGAGNLIQGNIAAAPGLGGGIYNLGGPLAGAARNYGTGNTPDDCAGAGCP